jgi:Glycosyl transferase family 8
MLLIDLDGWRREHIPTQLIECLAQNTHYVNLWDQYALTVALAGRWGSLDRRWNQGSHIYRFPTWELSPYDCETFEQQRDDPYIVHFTTTHKLWRAACRHPLRERFLDCLQRTDWAGWRVPRLEIVSEALKNHKRRFYRGGRWLRDQAWNSCRAAANARPHSQPLIALIQRGKQHVDPVIAIPVRLAWKRAAAAVLVHASTSRHVQEPAIKWIGKVIAVDGKVTLWREVRSDIAGAGRNSHGRSEIHLLPATGRFTGESRRRQ